MDITGPNDTFQDLSTEVNPSTLLMPTINVSTVSEYDIDNRKDTTIVTISTRKSSSISSSSATNTSIATNTSMATLSTSSPYIPDEFKPEYRMYLAPMITLILVIGIVANILAIIATRHAIKIYRTHRSRKVTIASYLIQCLMMVDLSAVLVFFIRGMFYTYRDSFFWCDLSSVVNYFFSWSAGFINAIMCFERCVALTAPFYYHSNATVGKAKVAVIAVLILALLTALLPIFGFGSYKTFINGKYFCIGPGDFMLDESGYDFHFGVLFLVTGLGILIFIHSCNTIVITKIVQIRRRASPMRRHIKKDINDGMSTKSTRSTRGETSTFMNTTYETTSSSSTAGNNTDAPDGEVGHHSPLRGDLRSRVKRPGRTEINVAKQIVVISIVFTISWLPFYIQRLLKAFDINQPDWYLLVVIFLLVSNHVIDPFVFVFMKQQSRDALKDLCMKCVCCRKCRTPPATESQHSSSNGRHHRDGSKQDSGVVVNVDPPYDLAHNRSHDPNHGHAPNSSFNTATNLALHPTQDSASYFVPSPDSTRNSEHDNSHNPGLSPAHNASTS